MLSARDDAVGAIDLTPVLHVTHLVVAPGHRRRGIGRSLLAAAVHLAEDAGVEDRKSTRLNSSHLVISYAVFCLKKKKSHMNRASTNMLVKPDPVPATFYLTEADSIIFIRTQVRTVVNSHHMHASRCADGVSPPL